MNRHRSLVVICGREHLSLFGWDCRVLFDQHAHHLTHGLNTQRQRAHIQQQDVFNVTGQDRCLDGRSHGDRLVWIHISTGLLLEEALHLLLHHGHTGLSAHQNDVIDVIDAQICVL